MIATVRNMGGVASTGPVTVRFSRPFDSASASGSGWTCSSNLACTTSSSVPPGGSLPALTLAFKSATHDSAGQYTVSSTLLNDSDSNLANNETTVRGEVGGVPH